MRFVSEPGLEHSATVRALQRAGATLQGTAWSGAEAVRQGALFAVGHAPELAPFTHGLCGHAPTGLIAARLEELAALVRLLEGELSADQGWHGVSVQLELPEGLPRAAAAATYKAALALRERGARLVECGGELTVRPCWPATRADRAISLRIDTDPRGLPLGVQLVGESGLSLRAAATLQEVFGILPPAAAGRCPP